MELIKFLFSNVILSFSHPLTPLNTFMPADYNGQWQTIFPVCWTVMHDDYTLVRVVVCVWASLSTGSQGRIFSAHNQDYTVWNEQCWECVIYSWISNNFNARYDWLDSIFLLFTITLTWWYEFVLIHSTIFYTYNYGLHTSNILPNQYSIYVQYIHTVVIDSTLPLSVFTGLC